MDNLLWNDIQFQARNLAHVITRIYDAERGHIDAAALLLQNDRPIALVGVASAQYLCMPAEVFLATQGRSAWTLCAAEALYGYLPALKHANVVINTRSGETAEVVKLGRALVENSIPFIAITNEPGSALAAMTDQVIWADTRKDDLVSINVVTAMMTVTTALAAATTGVLDTMRPDFEALGGAFQGVLDQATQKAGAIRRLFAGIRPVYLLYRGASKGAAYCGRLVLEEVSRTPAIAMGAAEFRQGPNEVIDERFGAVVFAPDGPTGALNTRLAEDILGLGGRVMLVGGSESLSAMRPHERLLTFSVPGVHACLRPALEVIPVQFLAYGLAEAQGYPPGQVRYISKVILSENGIPNQA